MWRSALLTSCRLLCASARSMSHNGRGLSTLMINLYARLAKKENAGTEALVDLLERILKKDREAKIPRFRDFISEVLLNKPTAEEEKTSFLKTLANIPGYSTNQWYKRSGQNLVQAENSPNIDSTGWYYYCSAHRGSYAKICPIQELLDDEGRLHRLQEWTHPRLAEAIQLWNVLFEGRIMGIR